MSECYPDWNYPKHGKSPIEQERDALKAEAQALREEVAALRARVVVPDGHALVPAMPTEAMLKAYREVSPSWLCLDGWRAMAEVAPHLNGKAVSEGLLRRILERLRKAQIFDLSSELSDALGEGKEHE